MTLTRRGRPCAAQFQPLVPIRRAERVLPAEARRSLQSALGPTQDSAVCRTRRNRPRSRWPAAAWNADCGAWSRRCQRRRPRRPRGPRTCSQDGLWDTAEWTQGRAREHADGRRPWGDGGKDRGAAAPRLGLWAPQKVAEAGKGCPCGFQREGGRDPRGRAEACTPSLLHCSESALEDTRRGHFCVLSAQRAAVRGPSAGRWVRRPLWSCSGEHLCPSPVVSVTLLLGELSIKPKERQCFRSVATASVMLSQAR